jgi:D-alanyl-D-alanine carboxypeptidase (penicillin-binding protein 5/6)
VTQLEKAQALGLKDTRFFNPTGLDETGEDNYATARDLAQLADYALDKELIWSISRTPEATVFSLDQKQKHYVKNTDELLWKEGNIYGGKTGYTVAAGQCLLLISETADKKHKVISVVLNAEDRFAEMKRLNDWVFNVYRW